MSMNPSNYILWYYFSPIDVYVEIMKRLSLLQREFMYSCF